MNNKGIKFLVAATVLALALAGTVAVVSDGDESYAEPTYVAQIGETKYETINDALSAATTGQTVLVIANTSEAVSSSNSGNITLDMNGCTLTGTVTHSGTGTLTIKDTKTGGGITYSGSDKSNINNSGTMVINGVSITKTNGTQYLIRNTGTLTIEAGTFSHSTTGAYGSMICNVGSSSNAKANLTINGGTFTYGGNNALLKNDDFGVMDVNGGTFNVTNSAPNIICNWCEMTIDGGTFNYSLTNGGCIYFGAWETGSTLTINGGTFTSSGLHAYNGGFKETYYQGKDGKPAVLEFGKNFSMETFIYDGGCYEVGNNVLKVKSVLGATVTSKISIDKGNIAGTIVKIGDVEYTTFTSAIAAASDGDELDLIADAVQDYNIKIGKSLTIDLNGHKLDLGTHKVIANNKKTVTIKDTEQGETYVSERKVVYSGGSIKSTGYVAYAQDGATMNIKSGMIDSGYVAVGTIGAGSKVIIDGAYIKAQEMAAMSFDGATLTIDSGFFYTVDNAVIGTNGTSGRGGNTISINGGYFIGNIVTGGYVACGVYVANNDAVTIKDAIFDIANGCGVLSRAGTVAVSGDVSIKCTGNTTGKVGDSRVVVPCSPIVVDYTSGYPGLSGDSQLTVNGGKYTSTAASITYMNTVGTGLAPSVTAGFFSSDPSDFVAQGYTVYQSGSIYAVGSPCTVTFDTQGGSAVPSKTVKFYEPAPVPAENPTMEGKKFNGWYTTASCDVEYDFSLPVTNDVTIYAGWTDAPKPRYTVSFESNGGSAVKSQVVEEGKTVVRPNDPSKDGSRFNGWYTTSELKTKYVFSDPVESNMVLYAGWIATCTLSIPSATAESHYTITPAQSVTDIDADHLQTVTVTVEAGYEGKLFINGVEQPGLTYAMTSVEKNISVSVKIAEASGKTTESTQEVTENDDGSVTDTNTVIETEGTTKTITEEASTTKDAVETEKAKTVAEVTGSGATVAIETDSDEAKVTESMAQAIIDAVEAGSAVAIDVSTPAVSVPANLFSNELGAKVDSVTVAVNQDAAAHSATITIPKGAIETGTESISLSVTPSQKQADAAALNGSSAVAAFDLTISNAASGTTFAKPVIVSYDVDLPAGAINVRFYCIDDKTAVPATYAGGTATGTLGHFSAWTIVYDMPADAGVEGDELPPTWHYVPQQQSSSSNTTMIVAACAAAVAAIAVALVMLNVVRKN